MAGIFDALGPISQILGAGGSLMQAFRKRSVNDEIPGLGEAMAAARDKAMYAQALAEGPSNPRFANLARIFEEQFRSEGIRGLRERMSLMNRLRARGGATGLFNNERRDESQNRAAIDLFSRGKTFGNQQAASSLGAAANASGNAFAGISPLLSTYRGYADSEFQRRADIPNAISKALGAIGGMNWGGGAPGSGATGNTGDDAWSGSRYGI